jgi:hypothetical protein
MEKEFVPYEQALALKELGFDEECLACWYNETPTNPEGQCLVYYKKPWCNQKIIKGIIRDYYYAPLYQQAFGFFREKYGYCVTIKKCTPSEYKFEIEQLFAEVDNYYFIDFVFKSHKEAELACLKKLIEIVKTTI